MTQPDWWFDEEPPYRANPQQELLEELVGGPAYCSRCHQYTPVVKFTWQENLPHPESPLAPYWRGTGRWDRFLASGERVVCWPCITGSNEWQLRYPWYYDVLLILAADSDAREVRNGE